MTDASLYEKLYAEGKLYIDNKVYFNIDFEETSSASFKREFLSLLRSVSECLFHSKIYFIKDEDNIFGEDIIINLEKFGEDEEKREGAEYDISRLIFHINKYKENPIVIEFYVSRNYPFLYSNIFNNTCKNYFHYVNSKSQFLLTYCPELVIKDTSKFTYYFKDKMHSGNEADLKKINRHMAEILSGERDISDFVENIYHLKITKWRQQNIVSYAQFGAADKLQDKLYRLTNHQNLIQELRHTLEGTLVGLT